MRNKNILVTGGAGFIGSHLADALVKQNKVVVLDNLSSGKKANLRKFIKKGGEFIRGDILDKSAMEKIMKNIDIVFHLAVQCVRLSFIKPYLVHEVNTTGTLNLLEAAKKANVKRFVYISSSEVYGTGLKFPMSEVHPTNPTTIYGASKLTGEYYSFAYLRSYGLPAVIVRPFNTYGPRAHFEGVYGEVIPKFSLRILNGMAPIIYGDGKQTRDFTFVKDTVAGIIAAGQKKSVVGEIINLAYGQEVSINELARLIYKACSQTQGEVSHKKPRPADVRRLSADTEKAARILNFKAKTSLARGIKTYINWLKSSQLDLKNAIKKDKEENWL